MSLRRPGRGSSALLIVAVDGFHEDVELGFEVGLLVLHCLNLSVEL